MTKRVIVLLGRSMLLSLVANSLGQCEGLDTLQVSGWHEVNTLSEKNSIDVLIYDLSAASEGSILPLLFTNPQLLLIGLDVETNRAVLISGKETRTLTLDHVKEIILNA